MYPISSLPTSVLIPDYFETFPVATENGTLLHERDFYFEHDTNGTLSIIKLNKVPYIDLTKYDIKRRKWYYVDQFEGLWRKYIPGDYVIEWGIDWIAKWSNENPRYLSQEGLGTAYFDDDLLEAAGLIVNEYAPIVLKLNDVVLTDISNYSGESNIVPKLDLVNTTNNKEFYFDKNTTIYTNQNLDLYEVFNLSLEYFVNIDKVNVKCRMNTNTTKLSNYTPIVDYYIVSLTGQHL
jgi:hypothetical protein